MFTFIKKFLNRFKSKDVQIKIAPTQHPVPAIPYDENFKNTLVPVIAIVGADGHITGYLPLAAENNGDGTASIKVTN